MPAPPEQPSLPLDFAPYINRGLFADHFLKERLPELPEWKAADGLDAAFDALQALYAQRTAGLSDQTNEAQTEDELIRPVLSLLWQDGEPGNCYQVQVSIPNVDQWRQPDYALFRSAADREGARPALGAIEYWRDVPALADAKRWAGSLDRQSGTEKSPSAQIANYLYRSRVRWGILTNGRQWRLYERERSAPGGIHYEVDLPDLLARGDRSLFRWFYLFFRRQAFLPDQSGATFLERVLQGSADYATEVGDRLKESVYDALRLLMTGFLEHPANDLDRDSPVDLRRVHDNALIVLYRLLFVLYAEDRGLLLHQEGAYAPCSLNRLQKEINRDLRHGQRYAPSGTRFWGQLTSLFRLIDKGFPDGGIPAYNGGLFSPHQYPCVAHTPQLGTPRWEIGDDRLAPVVDMLAYRRERWDQPGDQDIDYTTLQVQHLGSIYEGLLELRPQVASEELVEIAEKGKPAFRPAGEVPNPKPIRGQPPRRIAPGEVYLVSDRGERKATGSYYTPKFIVDYIVEQTLGPLADEAARQVAALRREVDAEITRLEALYRDRAAASVPEWDRSPDRSSEPCHAERSEASLPEGLT